MGNKMCKKKADSVDNPKSPSPFDRIITRLHLRPKSWKSDSHLHSKQINRYEINPKDAKNPNNALLSEPMSKSKSSDWTEAYLEVPEKDEVIHLKNPQLSFIFNDNSTPTPPPRKHKKTIREKIESVAKTGIQALQSKKPNDEAKKIENETTKVAEEPICVKRTIHYGCPCGDGDRCQHRMEKRDVAKTNQKQADKEAKRKKNLSVVSLPNYSELKFSVADGDNSNLKFIDASVSNSANSLPGEAKKSVAAIPPGKLENYMTRCRSFGSLLNNKLKVPKEPADVESDDSFGGLEDWDLGILEHYNPKDASLPRPRKPSNGTNALSDMEKLIVPEESFEFVPPVRPVRRSESLIKKMNREAAEATINQASEPPDDLFIKNKHSDTTPSSPPQSQKEEEVRFLPPSHLPMQDEEGHVEHSSLMRILQEYSIKDAQKRHGDDKSPFEAQPISEPTHINTVRTSNAEPPRFGSSGVPKQVSLNEKSVSNATSDFLNAEKVCVS